MRKLLLTFIALFSFICIHAEEVDAIYVWVDGSSTCYKFENMPTVVFDGTTANLKLDGKAEPVLSLDLESTSDLHVTFGVYKEKTAINSVAADAKPTTKVTQNGKYITGGRLIIIKDGKQYNPDGTRVK